MIPAKRKLDDLKIELSILFRESVCVVGLGNRQRGDDGAGVYVIDQRAPHTGDAWIDAGIAPENLLEVVVKQRPQTVLILDAVDFGGIPGDCRLFHPSALDVPALSTHNGSLNLLSDYWSARCGARVLVIGIQPQRNDYGCKLSKPVEESVNELATVLSELMYQQARCGKKGN